MGTHFLIIDFNTYMGQVVNMKNLSNPKSYELLKLKHKDVTRTKVKLMDFDLVQ
jgi:hypothetical protein